MIDDPGIFEPYFPGRSKALPRGYSKVVRAVGSPHLAGTILCRLER